MFPRLKQFFLLENYLSAAIKPMESLGGRGDNSYPSFSSVVPRGLRLPSRLGGQQGKTAPKCVTRQGGENIEEAL